MSKSSLKTKVIIICVALNLLQMLNGGFGIFEMNQFNEKFTHLTQESLPATNQLRDMRYWLTRGRMMMGRWAIPLSSAQNEDTNKKVTESLEKFSALAHEYGATDLSSTDRTQWNEALSLWEGYRKSAETFITRAKESDPQIAQDISAAVHSDASDMRKSAMKIEKILATLMESSSAETVAAAEIASHAYRDGVRLQWILIIIGFIAAQVIAQLFSNSIARRLDAIAASLSTEADDVSATAAEVSATSSAISSVTSQQAVSLQQTVSAAEELSAMVGKNVDNANQSRSVADRSAKTTHRGKSELEQVIREIGEIQAANEEIIRAVENSNKEISAVTQIITEVGEKTKVIDAIVFQTKLLSFNASVEAARAGEHGKGFAVVAEEVGNLAQMSGSASKEISAMLETSTEKVQKIVAVTQSEIEQLISKGKTKIENGKIVAGRCNEVLEELVKSSTEVTARVTEISDASLEQSKGISEINRAVSEMDKVIQENAASAQQAADASQHLSSRAEGLRTRVKELLAEVHGRKRVGKNPLPSHATAAKGKTAATLSKAA